jgi:hypothetical protein
LATVVVAAQDGSVGGCYRKDENEKKKDGLFRNVHGAGVKGLVVVMYMLRCRFVRIRIRHVVEYTSRIF